MSFVLLLILVNIKTKVCRMVHISNVMEGCLALFRYHLFQIPCNDDVKTTYSTEQVDLLSCLNYVGEEAAILRRPVLLVTTNCAYLLGDVECQKFFAQ